MFPYLRELAFVDEPHENWHQSCEIQKVEPLYFNMPYIKIHDRLQGSFCLLLGYPEAQSCVTHG
jgi:hypothetical protein